MKVLVVSSKYPPEYSGSGLRAHNTYQRLHQKFGIESEVIASGIEFPVRERYTEDGVSVERIVAPSLRKIVSKTAGTLLSRITNALMFHNEAREVRKQLAVRKFDLIHVFGYSPATVAAILWSRKNNIPLMLELVNLIESPYQYLPGTRCFTNYDLTNQSVIVAISKSLAHRTRAIGLANNVWTRPNPVDVSRYAPVSIDRKSEARSRLCHELGDDNKLVVYVAKFMARKNHSFLIDVLKYLPDNFKLVLAGPPLADTEQSPGITLAQMPTLEAKARALGVAERLTIVPNFVDHAEYLAAADVSCFPAYNEAMGTPLLEAIAAGVPVVANAVESSFQQWIRDAENGFLEPLNAEKWAKSIVAAADIPAPQRLKMSVDINNQISTEVIDQRYKLLLDRLVESTPDDTINVKAVLKS